MTAQVVQDANWTGVLVVVGILLALSAAAFIEAAWRTRAASPYRDDRPVIVRARLADLIFHDPCTHDGCANTVCFCASLTGPCPRTHGPRCWHSGPTVCDAHPGVGICCEIDARSEWGRA
jgi:hypothetical protein